MKHLLFAGLGAVVICASPVAAIAQDQGQITSKDVLTQPAKPAPESGGDIIVKFGDSVRIYFKRPIKSIRLGDDLTVKAVPESDHVVEFRGLAPGRSEVTVESPDGQRSSWGMVTVVRETHEVRIYGQVRSHNAGGADGVILTPSGEPTSDKVSSDYRSVLCNEVSCAQPVPKKE